MSCVWIITRHIVFIFFLFFNSQVFCKDSKNIETVKMTDQKEEKDIVKKGTSENSHVVEVKETNDNFGDLNDAFYNFDDFNMLNKEIKKEIIPLTFSISKVLCSFYVKKVETGIRADEYYKEHFVKNKFLFFSGEYSVDAFFKLSKAHKSLWDSALRRKPNNKIFTYIRDRFTISVGAFLNKEKVLNHFKYRIEYGESKSKKDVFVEHSFDVFRAGPAFKLSWDSDFSRTFFVSFMISAGVQINNGLFSCPCACKHTSVFLKHNYGGTLNQGEATQEYFKEDFKTRWWYVMFNLEFGYRFVSVFLRFFTPVCSEDVDSQVVFGEDAGIISTMISGGKIGKEDKKIVPLGNWIVSIGVSLSL